MAKKRQVEEEPPKGAPEWVVTFTDMISLLVTFFVLLMTYSSMDPRDYVKINSMMRTYAGGLTSDTGDVVPTFSEDDIIASQNLLRGADSPHSRPPEELWRDLEEMGQKETEEHVPVDLGEATDGLRILFPAECSFAPGSAEVSPELAKSLRELGDVLQFYSFLVVVEGFTDGQFRPTAGYPDAESISMARARNAAEILLASGDLSPELVQVAAIADRRPRATDRTPEGRQLNRRVQVRIVALSSAREALWQSRKDARIEGGD